MTIARRLPPGLVLLLSLVCMMPVPAAAMGVLQCVPYARALSGIRIRGDAWTWWRQAEGRYARGQQPRPGAVLSLAHSDVMPLGHVAVVSRIVDNRHILLRHANWSAPGLIEDDVLAVDSSDANDWSQVRIWWGQTGQMGARNNPVNGFIYPGLGPDFGPGFGPDLNEERVMLTAGGIAGGDRRMLMDRAFAPDPAAMPAHAPRLAVDASLFATARDTGLTVDTPDRRLAMLIARITRQAGRP